MNVKTVF